MALKRSKSRNSGVSSSSVNAKYQFGVKLKMPVDFISFDNQFIL